MSTLTRTTTKRSLSVKGFDREKRNIFGREHTNLRQQLVHQAKECQTTMAVLANAVEQNYPDIADELRTILRDHQAEVECKQSKKLQDSVENVAYRVSSVKALIGTARSGKAEDVDELQTTMQSVNEEMCDTKQEINEELNKLKLQETVATNELAALQKDIHIWSRTDHNVPTKPATVATRIKLKSSNLSNKPQAVVDYEKYSMANGGMTGGWDDFDHKEFLAFRQRHGAIDEELAEDAVQEIPTKTPADILEHEHWYASFAVLFAARKEALIGWKRAKNELKAVRELEFREEERKNTAKNEKTKAVIQEKRRVALTGQKAEKEREERVKAETAARIQLQKDDESRQKFRQHQAALKDRLDSHYGKLDQQLATLQLDQEQKLQDVKDRRHTATLQVREMGARELLRAEQRAMQKHLSKAKTDSRLAMQESFAKSLRRKVSAKVSTDPSRVVKPTRGWENRLAAGGDGLGRGKSGGRELADVKQKWQVPANIFDLSKLGIPKWRQEV